MLIACGCEDAIEGDCLRSEHVFKLALGRLPSAAIWRSQSTISWLESQPKVRTLLLVSDPNEPSDESLSQEQRCGPESPED